VAYRDFQDFLRVLEQKGELRRIKEPVSPYLEITEISDRVMKAGGPALLFENVVGPPHRLGTPNPESAVMGMPTIHPGEQAPFLKYDEPVAINTMGSRRRMSLALSCEDFEEHADRIQGLLNLQPPKGPRDALRKLAMVARELKGVRPREVHSAICQERVLSGDAIDLRKLPVLTCWPEDGGPFITLPMVFTHDPATGRRNVGMYRIQVFDARTCGMHWQMHKTGMRQMEDAGALGKRLEVCVVLGGDPAYAFAAIAPLPPGIDEMDFAGFIRRERVSLVKAKSVDVMVPADAEIVIEGYVDPSERRLEGPFGDHTGYYSLAAPFPVLHVTCVTMREKPVYPATIVGQPPMEDGWMGKAVERIFLPMIRLNLPEIVDMNLPVEAAFHNVAFVSIKKKYPGHAYKVMNAIWGLGGLAFTKFVFVFDEDCDVQDMAQVLFRLGANCDPMRDTLASKGPLDQLDHAAVQEGFGGKLGFDCTHKLPGENGFSRPFPKLITMSEDVKRRVDELWPKLGL
jgi:4-hydroxy-3-polyprenylbenzoate decarboxylase